MTAPGWANYFGTKMTHLDYVRDECFGIKLKRERERERERVGEKKSENESC